VYSNNRLRKFKARQAYWEIYKRYPLSKEAAYALHELLRGGYYKDIEEKLDIGIIIIEDYPEFEEYENSKVRLIRCFLEEPIPTEKLKHVYETNKNSFIKAMSLFGLAKKNCETKRSTHKKRQEIIYNEEGIDLLKKIDQEFSKTEVGDDALGNLAIHYYSKSDVENFRRILSLIEKKYPNATDVLHSYEEFQYEWIPALLLGYGELIFKVKKDGQKAKKVYQKVIKRYPNSRVITDFFCMFGVAGAEAQKEIAEIYTKQRNFERAVSEYKKLVLEFPEAIMGKLYTCGMISYGEVGLSEIVKIYKDNLKDQESLNNLMKDIITQSKSGGILAYCYNYLAKSALADGDPKAAITYYKRSAAFDLSALEEILQICLAKLNNPLLALKELEEIKNNFQNNTAKGCTTYLIAKVYYDELKDFMKGANLFKEFIINYPSGVGNEMYGPYYGAEEPFKKIVMAYRKKEDYEGLRRELGEIFEKCNSPHIKTKVLFTIAETFEKESNTAEAIETYKKLISQYPCSKEAREAKKKLKIEE
jgi:tetratricopeptide (TPR) repeat protein